MENPKYLEEDLSHREFVHHKSHMYLPCSHKRNYGETAEGNYFLVLLSVITLHQWVTIFQLLKVTSSPHIQGFISPRKILQILVDL
jgi:hypothetical protein